MDVIAWGFGGTKTTAVSERRLAGWRPHLLSRVKRQQRVGRHNYESHVQRFPAHVSVCSVTSCIRSAATHNTSTAFSFRGMASPELPQPMHAQPLQIQTPIFDDLLVAVGVIIFSIPVEGRARQTRQRQARQS
jgi:hypothetical protein